MSRRGMGGSRRSLWIDSSVSLAATTWMRSDRPTMIESLMRLIKLGSRGCTYELIPPTFMLILRSRRGQTSGRTRGKEERYSLEGQVTAVLVTALLLVILAGLLEIRTHQNTDKPT